MIISHKYRFIFIKTRKTAGTSVEMFLSSICGDEDIFTPFGTEEDGYQPRNYLGYFNPFDKMDITSARKLGRSFIDFLKRKKFYHHIPAYLVQSRVPQRIWNSYFKFCVERNPWDKTLSYYYFMKKRFNVQVSLDEFLEKGYDCLNYPQYMDYPDFNYVIIDRVIKYEDLNEKLDEIFRHLGIPFKGILDVYVKADYRTNRNPYQEVLSKYQREIIQKKHEKEIALFGYKY